MILDIGACVCLHVVCLLSIHGCIMEKLKGVNILKKQNMPPSSMDIYTVK